MARVSVIIPTHNRAAMLRRAIDSAKLAGDDLEIVVVDDASNDETEAICRNMTEIVYIRMDRNVGQARARNVGIRQSTGEFIAFLDDDDIRIPKTVDPQVQILEADKNVALVYGRISVGDPETCLPTGEILPRHCPKGDIFWELCKDNFIYISSVLVRRRHFEAVGLFELDVLGTEDWDAWLRLAERYQVQAVPEPVAIYRNFSTDSGQTSSHRPSMCKSGARTQAKALRSARALKADPALRRELRLEYMDRVWNHLIREAEHALSSRHMRYAVNNYLTAIQLHPKRGLGVVRSKLGRLLGTAAEIP